MAPSTAHHPELWPNIGCKWTHGRGADHGVQSKRNPCSPPQLAERWSSFGWIRHAPHLVSLDREFEEIRAIVIFILLSEKAWFIIHAVQGSINSILWRFVKLHHKLSWRVMSIPIKWFIVSWISSLCGLPGAAVLQLFVFGYSHHSFISQRKQICVCVKIVGWWWQDNSQLHRWGVVGGV